MCLAYTPTCTAHASMRQLLLLVASPLARVVACPDDCSLNGNNTARRANSPHADHLLAMISLVLTSPRPALSRIVSALES